MSEYRNLAKNTVIFAIGQFSVKIIQFFLMPVLTIALTTEDYGSAESIASLAELVIPLCTLGLQDAVFRFCMRKDVDKKAVLSSTMAVAVLGLIAVIGGALLASLRLPTMQCVMFIVLYIGYSLSNIFGQYIRGNGYIKTYASSGVLQALLLAACTAIFVYWLRWGAFGYMLSMSIAYLCSVMLMFVMGRMYQNISLRAFDKTVLKDMLRYALPLIPNAVSWWFMQVVNRYILIWYIDNSAAGLYISASKIATIVNIFGTIFLQAWTISTVNSLNDEKKGEFNTKIFRAYGAFIQMAAFGILLLLPFVSRFLLQGEFYDAWRYSAIAVYTAVLSCYASFFGAFYGANMKTNMVLVSTLAGAVANTAFCFLLVWRLGILGALYANLIGYFILTVIRIVTTKKYSQIKTDVLREIVIMVVLLGDAVMITYCANTMFWWYWLIQAAAICLFVVLSFKDIKAVFSSIVSAAKKMRAMKSSRNAEKDSAPITPSEENTVAETDSTTQSEAEKHE